jgi:hypothetical protein
MAASLRLSSSFVPINLKIAKRISSLLSKEVNGGSEWKFPVPQPHAQELRRNAHDGSGFRNGDFRSRFLRS